MSAELSLLDTGSAKVREWYLVYHARTPFYRASGLMKQGFRHVELVRPLQYGPKATDVMWLQLLPTFEMLDVDLCMDPRPPWVTCPQSTIQKVTAVRHMPSVREWFHVGPVSCVEVAKFALGIKSFWVNTPWQLYKYIDRRQGVVVS